VQVAPLVEDSSLFRSRMRVQLFNRMKRILIEVLLMPKTLEELGQTEISELINRRVSIFAPEDTVSRVRGELLMTGRYEAIVSGGGKVGLVTIRDLLNAEQQEQMKVERIWTSQSPVTSDSWVKGVASELVTMSGHMKSFQDKMKVKIATAVRAGRESGRMTRTRMLRREAPSMVAASSSSCGMFWKNCRSRKTPNPLATVGMIRLK